MLSEHIKTLIAKEAEFNPRLTGVFFRKYLHQSCYDDQGMLTELALECHQYFAELKRAAEQKAFRARLANERVTHERHEVSRKLANQNVNKSRVQSRARFIGSLRFVLTGQALTVRTESLTMPNPAKVIRSYLKKLGVSRLGKSLSDGLVLTGDAIEEVLSCLSLKHQVNDTVPTPVDIAQSIYVAMKRYVVTEKISNGSECDVDSATLVVF